jgi:hypothetical protein
VTVSKVVTFAIGEIVKGTHPSIGRLGTEMSGRCIITNSLFLKVSLHPKAFVTINVTLKFP